MDRQGGGPGLHAHSRGPEQRTHQPLQLHSHQAQETDRAAASKAAEVRNIVRGHYPVECAGDYEWRRRIE